MGRHLDAQVALDALRMTLAARLVAPGLVHHSNRGVQYGARAYTDLLTMHRIQISMSRRATPYDNARRKPKAS